MFYENYEVEAILKTVAKAVFIIEVIASIIVCLAFVSDEEYLKAFISIFAGIVVSYVSNIVIFAFGEAIELLRQIKDNSKNLVKESAAKEEKKKQQTNKPTHSWRCNTCGRMISEDVCPYCAEKFNL